MVNLSKDLSGILTGKLPRKLSETEGILLKQYFEQISSHQDKNAKELYFKYTYEVDSENYILTEEYLFRDYETVLDIRRAIARNYYIKKVTGE